MEKLCLIKPSIGQDSISDFTTNLIKEHLCQFTEDFATEHLDDELCDDFQVERVAFNYDTETWVTKTFHLPRLRDDYVLLTPVAMLTRVDTWINHSDMISMFSQLPLAVSNDQQRSRINNYFAKQLSKDPTNRELREAASDTVRRFPELIDLYIRLKENSGDRAEADGYRLFKNKQLKRNLQNQVEIYKDANRTPNAAKVIVIYAENDENRAKGILKELGIEKGARFVVAVGLESEKSLACEASALPLSYAPGTSIINGLGR